MAYIYQITNNLNGKIYIGKTERSIEQRWYEHCRDYLRKTDEKRPLYLAMRKYGPSNFSIIVLEETNNASEREVYWIEKTRAFKNGYNATMGGDGQKYLDYDLIIASYNELQNIAEVARRLNIHYDTVSRVLHSADIDVIPAEINSQRVNGKIVNQYDLQGNFIQSFPSLRMAAESLGKITPTSKGATSHISDVCKNKRKTAYGFIWRFEQ